MNRTPPSKKSPARKSWKWPLLVGLLGSMAVGAAAVTLVPSLLEPPAPDTPAATVPAAPPALDPQQVALGERVYFEACASCHGANLEGQPNWQTRNEHGKLPAPPHDETGHTWHHPDAQLFAITKFGLAPIAGADYATDMPAYEGVLTDAEILAVLAYIKSRWPEKIRAHQARIDAQARTQQQN
jgi:mono/diheme cytochrome c family protein